MGWRVVGFLTPVKRSYVQQSWPGQTEGLYEDTLPGHGVTTTRRQRYDDATTTRRRRDDDAPPPRTHEIDVRYDEARGLCPLFAVYWFEIPILQPLVSFHGHFSNKELDIASFPSPLRLSNKILSHTQGDLISISSLTFDLAPFRHDIISRLLRPPAFEPRISLASLPIPLHSLADPQTLHVRYAVTSQWIVGRFFPGGIITS